MAQKAAVKKPSAKKPKPAAVAAPTIVRLSSVLQLTKKTLSILRAQPLLFVGIGAVYAVLSLIFVTGLGTGVDVANVRNQFGNRFLGGVATYTQLIGSTNTSSGQAASVYQILLFVVASLAIIWGLRRAWSGEASHIRDAYYRGMYPLVPFILVLAVIGLQLLPIVIGTSLYQVVVVSGIAATTLEVAAWALLVVALCLLSLYLLAASLLALYIVTLPDMTPLAALRSAKQLVKGRRWTVLRKLVALPVGLFLVAGALLLPFILILPGAAVLLLPIVGGVVLVLAHAYSFTLYRELIGE